MWPVYDQDIPEMVSDDCSDHSENQGLPRVALKVIKFLDLSRCHHRESGELGSLAMLRKVRLVSE